MTLHRAWTTPLEEPRLDGVGGFKEQWWLIASKARDHQEIAGPRADPDLGRNMRMMIPLFKDIEQGESYVLAALGFGQPNLKVRFARRPGC